MPTNPIYNGTAKYLKSFDNQYYLIVLGMIYATIFFSSFVMGYKVVDLNGRIFCASVFIFPLLFPINDSITEIFGVKVSYFMIIAVITCEFLFGLLTHFVALLPSPQRWQNQAMYPILTSGFLHIAIADSSSLAIGFFANAYFLNIWGIRLSGKGFFIRSLGATAIGELVFTILTNLITFYSFHTANIHQTANIIISDYIFKMIYSFIICIPNAIIVKNVKNIFSKNAEMNQNTNIAPFSRIIMKYRT